MPEQREALELSIPRQDQRLAIPNTQKTNRKLILSIDNLPNKDQRINNPFPYQHLPNYEYSVIPGGDKECSYGWSGGPI